MDIRHFGRLVFWNEKRNYGFVDEYVDLPSGNYEVRSYFLHGTKILSGHPELNAGVHFDVKPSNKPGKDPWAINAEIIHVVKNPKQNRQSAEVGVRNE